MKTPEWKTELIYVFEECFYFLIKPMMVKRASGKSTIVRAYYVLSPASAMDGWRPTVYKLSLTGPCRMAVMVLKTDHLPLLP